MKKLGAALAARGDDLVIQRLRARERLFVRRDDVHARAEQRRVRLRHRHGGRIVDEHDGVVAAHKRRELALQVRQVVLVLVLFGGSGGGAEEGAPVGGGRDAFWVEDGRFGGGERDEADWVWGRERLELPHKLGAD